jgi:UDP-3-O-[3-hydroxymyristoyl] glucosamine N-acyltransferase
MKAREIADLVGGELHGDGEIEITSVADIDTASAGQIAFFDKTDASPSTAASCVIVPSKALALADERRDLCIISVGDPKLAFAKTAGALHPRKIRTPEIHPTAFVSASAKIGDRVFIGAHTCIGDDSTIGNGTQIRAGAKVGDSAAVGKNCVLHPNVFIEDGCTIGNNVVLHAGVVIGADGFGYVRDARTTPSADHPGTTPSGTTPSAQSGGHPSSNQEGRAGATPSQVGGEYLKFPQIGTVVIEDNVEIGANTCVDRGALGETRIGEGTKIDNLVQVGHNVRIGKRCVIAAQTGISGSTVIEDDCVIGGQVGFGDHARVKSGAVIGSQAGVLPGKIVRPGVWWGTPIQPLEEYKRQNAHLKSIGRMKAEIKDLKNEIRSKER